MYCPADNTLAVGPPTHPDRSLRGHTRWEPNAIITSLALVVWFRTRFSRYEVADHSMAPLLAPGDYLLARPIRTGRELGRGDIVVFLSGHRHLVKRVIGLPGETVSIDGGVVMIGGAALHEPWWSAATRPDGHWTVPEDSFFVLGDNRTDSAHDSRSSGPITREAVHSVVTARYWPLRRLRRIP